MGLKWITKRNRLDVVKELLEEVPVEERFQYCEQSIDETCEYKRLDRAELPIVASYEFISQGERNSHPFSVQVVGPTKTVPSFVLGVDQSQLDIRQERLIVLQQGVYFQQFRYANQDKGQREDETWLASKYGLEEAVIAAIPVVVERSLERFSSIASFSKSPSYIVFGDENIREKIIGYLDQRNGNKK